MEACVRTLAVCVLALLFPACLPFAIFEDVGSDPHPPTLELLAFQTFIPVEPEPEEAAAGARAALRGAKQIIVNAGEITIGPREAVAFLFQWSDAGGDLVHVVLRDRDLGGFAEFGPSPPDLDGDGLPDEGDAPPFFLGTSGLVIAAFALPLSHPGPHRLEFWAEDSHGSRSAKTAFTITLVL